MRNALSGSNGTVALLSLLAVGCGGDGTGSRQVDAATWVTQPQYQFSGAPEADVLFSQVPYLRVDPRHNRVLVLDMLDKVISAWTPEGSLEFVVGGPGGGPGEFVFPTRIDFEAEGGFHVREGFGTRFTHYTSEGTLLRAVRGTTTALSYDGARLELAAYAGNGGYIAVPRIGWVGPNHPNARIDRNPILAVQRADSIRWLPPEPIFWLDYRNAAHFVDLGDDRTSMAGQMFSEMDRVEFEPGAAVVMRQTGGPGVVEMIELDSNGDTTWLRPFQFAAHRLTPARIRREGERWAEVTQRPGVSRDRYLEAWEASLHKPEYRPTAIDFKLTASGEAWLKSFERVDTLRVYYAVKRGDMSGNPRRVLLPEWMSFQDATDTHVWGIREDSLGLPYVVGRRLVPAS